MNNRLIKLILFLIILAQNDVISNENIELLESEKLDKKILDNKLDFTQIKTFNKIKIYKSLIFGIKSGLNLSTWYGSYFDFLWGNLEKYRKLSPGFVGGISFEAGVFRILSIHSEILFSMKGVMFRFTDQDIAENQYLDVIDLMRSYYIDIPVNIKIILPINSIVKPNFCVGPNFSFLIFMENQEIADGKMIYNINIKNLFNMFDFGISFGGGIDISLGSIILSFNISYSLGFLQVYKNVNDIKNSCFTFTLGFGYNLFLSKR